MPSRRTSTTRIALCSALACAALAVPAVPTASAAQPDFVGIASDETFRRDGAFRRSNLAAERRAGVRLIRQVFDWSLIEKSPGVFDLRFLDFYVADVASQGIRIMPVLTNAPTFRERAGSTRGARRPTSDQDLANLATVLVRRYGSNGTLWSENPGLRKVPIRTWQVWNEPSLAVYWGPRPNAREYVSMLKTVGTAVKRADRRAEVVTAGLPPSLLTSAVPLTRYLTQMYRAGAARYFDVLAINAYARHAKDLDRLLRDVRKLMNRRGDRRTPIWVTELGWGDRGPRHRFVVGRKGQARNITTSFETIRKLRRKLRLRGLVYFSWRDTPPYAPLFRDQWGLHTGLLTLTGRRKPAYRAFVRAARRLR